MCWMSDKLRSSVQLTRLRNELQLEFRGATEAQNPNFVQTSSSSLRKEAQEQMHNDRQWQHVKSPLLPLWLCSGKTTNITARINFQRDHCHCQHKQQSVWGEEAERRCMKSFVCFRGKKDWACPDLANRGGVAHGRGVLSVQLRGVVVQVQSLDGHHHPGHLTGIICQKKRERCHW